LSAAFGGALAFPLALSSVFSVGVAGTGSSPSI